MPQTTLARGNLLYDWIIGPTLTPVAVLQATSAPQNFTVPGLQLGDILDVNFNGTQTAGVGIVNARVSATDTMTLTFSNSTAGTLTPAAGQYFINICRVEGGLAAIPTTAA